MPYKKIKKLKITTDIGVNTTIFDKEGITSVFPMTSSPTLLSSVTKTSTTTFSPSNESEYIMTDFLDTSILKKENFHKDLKFNISKLDEDSSKDEHLILDQTPILVDKINSSVIGINQNLIDKFSNNLLNKEIIKRDSAIGVNIFDGEWPIPYLLSVVGLTCIVFFTVVLFLFWLLKRVKLCQSVNFHNHNSIITESMAPSILPNESTACASQRYEANVTVKKPAYFPNEVNEDTFLPKCHLKISLSSESCDSGIDNLGFVDNSSHEYEDITVNRKFSKNKNLKSISKYINTNKRMFQGENIKLCSTDGHIFPVSPLLTSCLVAPPPYDQNSYPLSCVPESVTECSVNDDEFTSSIELSPNLK